MSSAQADQKTQSGGSDNTQPTRFEEGQANAHKPDDSRDQRTIANRLENETTDSSQDKNNTDPNVPNPGQTGADLAREHGNKPSKGALIDEQLALEEEVELRKKGAL